MANARLALGVVAALVLLGACPKLAPPAAPPTAPELATLRPEVERLSKAAQALLRAQDEQVWKGWTEGAPIEIEKTYQGQQALFTPQSIQAIRRLRELTAEPAARRGLTHLEAHFVGEYLAQQLTEVSAAIANVEASATVEVAGKEHPFRELPRLLANEKSAEKRRALYAAAAPAVERISQSLRRREAKVSELLAGLGYPSHAAFAAGLREATPESLRALAEQVLSTTDSAYVRLTGELAQKELSLPRASLTRADIARLFRPRGGDNFFPKDALPQRVGALAAGLGVDLAALKNLTVDARDVPRKNPRPLALPVEVPNDVRLSYKPMGGVEDYGSTFHELAHALHYAHAQPLPFELAKLGSPAVTEAYGYLLEDLLADPIWLQQNTPIPADRLPAFLSASSAYLLHRLREAAGAVLYGLQARDLDDAEAKALYAQVMGRVYGIKLSPEEASRYLLDREDFLESADALRSLCLAGQLQGQLKVRFGPTWWTQPAAGELLRSLWGHANAKSAEEIAALIGESGVRPEVLLSRLAAALGTPIRGAPRASPRPSAPDAGAPDAG